MPRLLAREIEVSDQHFEWLGTGFYLWQDSPWRAQVWAVDRFGDEAAVVVVCVSLDGCLDLLDPHWQEQLRIADAEYMFECVSAGRMPARNRPSGNRARDCAVINWFCEHAAREGRPVRSARAIFEEGAPIFEESAIRALSHTQIAVRDVSVILEIEDSAMVKLVDPTIPYADIIPRRRRERAAADGEAFRLGTPGYDWRAAYPEPGSRAVIAAGDSALDAARVEHTAQVIGTVAGLLADMGFQVFPAKALSGGDLEPALILWVNAGTTTEEELVHLRSIGAPGVSVGSAALSLDGWCHIDTAEFNDWRGFVKRVVGAVAALVEIPEAAIVSNNVSNEPRRTDPDDAGRTVADQPADLHQHGRSRTGSDALGPGPSGS